MLGESGEAHVSSVIGIRDVACTHQGCGQKFSSTGRMQMHVNAVHLGIKDIACTHEVDSECHIRYAGGCVPDPDKFCSRLDMHLVGITTAITIVECDEFGHKDYGLSCELSRMEQAHEGIIKAQFSDMVAAVGERKALVAPQKPVVFVRCNPDGRVVDGVKERVRREERDAQLLRVLAEIESGILELPNPLNIVYIGYDMLDGEPVVCYDPVYAEQMRACVVLAV
jgi:hypothetical protein